MNGYMDRKPGGYDTTGTPRVDLNAKRAMFESMRQEATIGFLQSALHPGIYNTPRHRWIYAATSPKTEQSLATFSFRAQRLSMRWCRM